MAKSHYIIPIFVPHVGCPHNCIFCNQSSITGSRSDVTDIFVEKTINEYLSTIKSNNSIIEVSFFGGTFTAIDLEKQKELLRVAKHFKDNGSINYIRLSTRPDYINERILDNLKAFGVDIIELGIQSLDKEVLIKAGRGHSEQQVIDASNLIKQYGFTLGHQIMLGLPGDNFEKDIKTTLKSIHMKPEICRIYPALVIKDTPMESLFLRGEYSPYTLEEAIEISKIVYGLYRINGINVIRIGLQPTEEIAEGKGVIAGPFHPAFRELVEGNLFNEMLLNEIPKDFQGEVIIRINPQDISKLYGNRKQFFIDTKKQLKTIKLTVVQDNSVNREILNLKWNNDCKNVSIFEYLLKKHKEGYYNIL